MPPTLNNTPTGTGATNPTTGGTNNNLTPGTNTATPDNASNSSNVPPGGPTNSVAAAADTAEYLVVEDIIKQLKESDDIGRCLLCLYSPIYYRI